MVAYILIYWLLGMASFALYFERHPLYAVSMCSMSILLMVGSYAGWKWAFWLGALFTIFAFHIGLATLLDALLERRGRVGVHVVRSACAVSVILAFQATSTLNWFRFKDVTKTRFVFWMVYAGLFLWSATEVALVWMDPT